MSSSCAPPPYVMCCCCHVICSHPPQAWDSHRVVVVVVVCQEVISVFWGSSYDFVRFFLISILFYFFVTISIQHRSRALCLGNAAHPPTFPNKPHAFTISSCTHTRRHTQKSTPTHLPHSHPQPSIPHIFRKPTHSEPTHPLIPPSFFRFNHQKQLGYIHSTTDYSTTLSLQHMKWTPKNAKIIWHQKHPDWAHVTRSGWSSSKPRNPNTFLQCRFMCNITGPPWKCRYWSSATGDKKKTAHKTI